MPPRTRPRVASALLAAALAACAAGAHRVRGVGTADDAILEVRNSYLGAVDVVAVRDGGFRVRLGQVFTGRTERFVLGPSLIGATAGLAFFATPAAGSGAASTGVVTVRPGSVVRFNVAADLPNSTVFVR